MKRFENHFTNPLYIFVLLLALSTCGKDDKAEKKAAAEEEARARIARYEKNIQNAEISLEDFRKNSDKDNVEKIASALKTLAKDMEALLLDLGITSELLKEVASRDGDPQLSATELEELKRALENQKLTPLQRQELNLLRSNMNLLQKIESERKVYKDKLLELAERDVVVREKHQKAVSSYLSFRKTFSTVMALFGTALIVVAQVLAAIIVTR